MSPRRTKRPVIVRRNVPYVYDMPLDELVASLQKATAGMKSEGRLKPTVSIEVTQRYGDYEIDVVVTGQQEEA